MDLLSQLDRGGTFINSASLVGTVASLLGFYFAWRTFRRVKRIEKSYTQQALLPRWISNLKWNLRNITTLLEQKQNEKALLEFAKCASNLDSLSEHIDQKHLAKIQTSKTEISNLDLAKADAIGLMRKAEKNLYEILQLAENANKALRWRASRDDE